MVKLHGQCNAPGEVIGVIGLSFSYARVNCPHPLLYQPYLLYLLMVSALYLWATEPASFRVLHLLLLDVRP